MRGALHPQKNATLSDRFAQIRYFSTSYTLLLMFSQVQPFSYNRT